MDPDGSVSEGPEPSGSEVKLLGTNSAASAEILGLDDAVSETLGPLELLESCCGTSGEVAVIIDFDDPKAKAPKALGFETELPGSKGLAGAEVLGHDGPATARLGPLELATIR